MKNKLSRILCLVLCAVVLCGLMPGTVWAEITEDDTYGLTFTTTEDLLELCAAEYDNTTNVYCFVEDFVIEEDVTIPENLEVNFTGGVVIPEGVTVTLGENNWTYFDHLVVNGTYINHGSTQIPEMLTVNGEIYNYGGIHLSVGASQAMDLEVVDGTGSIFACEGEYALGWVDIGYNLGAADAYERFMYVIEIAEQNPDFQYTAYAYDSFELTLIEDVTIPENCCIFVGAHDPAKCMVLNIAEGCTLTVNGQFTCGNNVNVAGTLAGYGNVQVNSSGVMNFEQTGSYQVTAPLFVYKGDKTELQNYVPGLNLSDFDIYDEDWLWVLNPNSGSGGNDTEPGMPFTDMAADAYYVEPIFWAVDCGITTGLSNTEFGVDVNCTRAQFVTFLWRAAGCPEPTSAVNQFADVEKDQFYSKAVLWAVENGITTGLAADKFGVNDPCTRAQVVTFLHRFAGKPEPTITDNPFKDAENDQFYSTAILWAVENGITTGLDAATFGVNLPCNRAQVVTFLFRAIA